MEVVSSVDTVTDRESIEPVAWREGAEEFGMSSVLRDGRWLFVSGCVGPADGTVEEQVRGAFDDVTIALTEAGAGWGDVVSITSYHVGLRRDLETIVRIHNEYVREPYPAWTGVGITEVTNGSIIEVSVIARLPDDRSGSGT